MDQLKMIVLGILILLFLRIVFFLIGFFQELQCINKEIELTAGEEREYWVRCRRQLWLSLIPFVKF